MYRLAYVIKATSQQIDVHTTKPEENNEIISNFMEKLVNMAGQSQTFKLQDAFGYQWRWEIWYLYLSPKMPDLQAASPVLKRSTSQIRQYKILRRTCESKIKE